MPLEDAASRCCCFGAGAAAGCRCRVLLQGTVRAACALWSWPVLLQGATAGCCCQSACALWNWLAGAAAGCRCAVRVARALCGAGLPVPLLGAGCRVLLSKSCLYLRNLGAATGYCCQSAVCAMKLGYWCQGVAATCLWQCGRWALMAITCMP